MRSRRLLHRRSEPILDLPADADTTSVKDTAEASGTDTAEEKSVALDSYNRNEGREQAAAAESGDHRPPRGSSVAATSDLERRQLGAPAYISHGIWMAVKQESVRARYPHVSWDVL